MEYRVVKSNQVHARSSDRVSSVTAGSNIIGRIHLKLDGDRWIYPAGTSRVYGSFKSEEAAKAELIRLWEASPKSPSYVPVTPQVLAAAGLVGRSRPLTVNGLSID